MKGVTIIDHPLVQQGLTHLRDRSTLTKDFRRILSELTALLVYEATRDLKTQPRRVITPLAVSRGVRLRRPVVLVPVLRAGLGMLEPLLRLIPDARVGFIGMRRDETTLAPSIYHQSLPKRLGGYETILIDPMLATGGSAVAALNLLACRGSTRIRFVNLVAAPEGIRRVRRAYPAVHIFTAAVDRGLNDLGFILPGLGDAGDRLFGV